MVSQVAWINTEAHRFWATVDLDVKLLDRENMPLTLCGEIKKFEGIDQNLADFAIHAERSHDGSSHTMWFNNKRDAYRFAMDATGSARFTATSLPVNPITGLPGFQRVRP